MRTCKARTTILDRDDVFRRNLMSLVHAIGLDDLLVCLFCDNVARRPQHHEFRRPRERLHRYWAHVSGCLRRIASVSARAWREPDADDVFDYDCDENAT